MSSMKIELSTIGRTHVQWDDTGLHNTVRIAIAPEDLAILAAANGYVKLEPGQVVVQVEDLTRIVTWFKGDARTVPHTDMDTTLNRFTAALDASGG